MIYCNTYLNSHEAVPLKQYSQQENCTLKCVDIRPGYQRVGKLSQGGGLYYHSHIILKNTHSTLIILLLTNKPSFSYLPLYAWFKVER